MDDATRLSIISAAITATGPQTAYTTTVKQTVAGEGGQPVEVDVTVLDPGAWQAKVQENAINIMVMSGENSAMAKALTGVANAKVFPGTVMGVKKEQSSTRGKITLHTGTDRAAKDGDTPLPAGCEQVRTERTDNVMGLSMARRMKGLIGHRVLLWVEVEEYGNGSGKVRVLRHVEDLGVDPQFAEKQTTTGLAPAA